MNYSHFSTESSSNGITADPDWEAPLRRIPKGSRNSELTSIAGAMRRRGCNYAEIRAALLIANQQNLEEPLPTEEVERIAWSVSRYPAAEPNAPTIISYIVDPELGEIPCDEICLSAPYSDLGNAQVFAALYSGKFLYDHTRKKWMVWSKEQGAFHVDTNEAAKRAMMAALQMRHTMTSSISDDTERTRARAALRKFESKRAIDGALDIAKTFREMAVTTDVFDTDIWKFNALGTLFDVSREAIAAGNFIRDTTPGDLISKSTGTRYDPDATAPLWTKFLEDVFSGDTELIGYIQRVCGYMLTGDTTEQALWIAFGSGANGTSTFLNTLQALLSRVPEEFGRFRDQGSPS